jgi:hypothetical protein
MNGLNLLANIKQVHVENLAPVKWKTSAARGVIITPSTHKLPLLGSENFQGVYKIGNQWFGGGVTYIENDFYGKLTDDPWIWEEDNILYSANFKMLDQKGLYHIVLEPL